MLKPKHSKKDYDRITSYSVEDIINSASVAPKKKKLERDQMSFDEIVKISEKKKKFRKKSKEAKQK